VTRRLLRWLSRELTVTVTRSGETGGRAARFKVDGELNRVCFASWDGERLNSWPASAAGEGVELPYRPGLMYVNPNEALGMSVTSEKLT